MVCEIGKNGEVCFVPVCDVGGDGTIVVCGVFGICVDIDQAIGILCGEGHEIVVVGLVFVQLIYQRVEEIGFCDIWWCFVVVVFIL